MVADVYSASTSTTTITDVNSNAAAQTFVMDQCNISAELDINITQSVSQLQSIQQTASVQNTQLSTTSVDQSLIQQAQSSVSSWGIGVAAASNNMSVATSVSTSVKNAVDESFSNLNSLTQNIVCSNSSLTSNSGSVNISQTGAQSISATQLSESDNLQSVTTDVSQSASQTATATVSGLDLMGMIVAGIVLTVVLGVVMAIVKSKATQAARSSGLMGGALYKLTSTELKMYVAGAVLVCVLAALGAVGLLQRPQHACDFTGQCTPTSSQFWFGTSGATCSVPDRYTTLSKATDPSADLSLAPVPTLVAPPLFLCSSLRSPVEFGAAAPPSLYPGALQLLVVASKVNNASTSTTDTSAPQRNNSGYNVGVYSLLLRTACASSSGADAARTTYIQALAAWFVRQTFTLDADGQPLLATPASADDWCANRILRDLLPIQPVFTEPQAGLKCTRATTDAEVTVPPKTSTLRRRLAARKKVNLAAAACAASTGTDSTGYLVRLPGSFLATAAVTRESSAATSFVTYLCLPNAFVPDVATPGASASLFLGNATETAAFPTASTCYYSTDLTAVPSGVSASRAVFTSTCVQTAAKDAASKVTTDRPRLATDYACGCLGLDAGEACWGDGPDTYTNNDLLCYVNSGVATHLPTTSGAAATYSRRGGFILRRGDTFASSIYDTEATDADLYKYAATPAADRLDAWVAANPGVEQRRRLHMFLRIYWWLLLTVDVKNRTLSELGLSTFVNDAGFSDTAPNVSMDSDGVTTLPMYSAQPLLVKKSNGTYAFYTLQELREGAALSSAQQARVPVADAAACLAQVGMWCYDPSALGLLGVEVASNGFNVAITGSTADAAGQLVQSTAQRGLLVGRHGFCKLWFTSDAYVASTLGVACAVLVLLIVYGIAMNTR
jgi:hypothetical protein